MRHFFILLLVSGAIFNLSHVTDSYATELLVVSDDTALADSAQVNTSSDPRQNTDLYDRELQLLVVILFVMLLVIFALVYYLNKIKISRQAAEQSQMILESVFDQSYQYIGILDGHGRLISSNSKLQSLIYDQSYQLDKPIWYHKHWHNKSADQIKQFFSNHGTSQSKQFEGEVWQRERGVIVLDLSLKAMTKHVGYDQLYLLEARDITTRKVTEDKLFQREAKLSHYYDQQPVMMITIDDDNRIQQVNRFAERLLGYPSSDILGHKLSEFYLSDESLSAKKVLLQPSQAIEGVWRREVEYKHFDGSVIYVRENIRSMVESGQVLIVGEDISEMRQLADQLAYQARFDLLTDTYNRNHFELELEKAVKEIESHLRSHAMLYLDMDQLKVLNDTAGHEAGDAAIQFAASMLESILPYNAILARMGGDEFAILLKDCTELDAIKLSRNIIKTLGEQAFLWDHIRLKLTCSIGIRLIDHTAASPQMVHAQADTACHVAKEEGRNRYNLYQIDDKELQQRELEMECVNLVHDALEYDRIELFAQRILSLDGDNSVLRFEILSRIRNHKGDYISPGVFIPASERYNIAHLIDKYVVSHTLKWLEDHPEEGERIHGCSINLSGQSIGNQEFIDFLLLELKSSPVSCSKICFEITETAAMNNMDQSIDFFGKLKALGCVIALDDFGSGLSSFGYLKKLPVDIVKIDGLFVRDIDVNEMDYVMVRSINDLAKQMGKKTVAEFVENSEIIDRLIELGVDYGQGYFIGKPMPIERFIREVEEA
ncbi:sensor domain-containing protein [Vibrio amylolyticus]|uniref:sensor domain-containing protein n=1 Tax=Vibrio amylolyticus TaxID=2847292 RepID=UPI0031F3531F